MEEFSKSVFEQTVVASPEQLQILPENILSLFHNYTEGKLQPTSSEEVLYLLQCWFNGTLTKKDVVTNECEFTPCDIDVGLESNIGHKRQRFDCNI
jgi:hypothetical protein